ncbi:MAG: DUF4926 domain-containing protein [Kiritimatiellia bacterium]
MIKEHDRVVLTLNVADKALEKGDVGTVVHVYSGGDAFEVEFVSLDGRTEAIATLKAPEIRPLKQHEISHARELAIA